MMIEKISSELAKHSHPLIVQSEVLYNIVNVDESAIIVQTLFYDLNVVL